MTGHSIDHHAGQVPGKGNAMYHVEKSKAAQRAHQEKNSYPDFAPADGVCWACHENIYIPKIHRQADGSYYVTGVDTKKAGVELITGCPHCHRTYCD